MMNDGNELRAPSIITILASDWLSLRQAPSDEIEEGL